MVLGLRKVEVLEAAGWLEAPVLGCSRGVADFLKEGELFGRSLVGLFFFFSLENSSSAATHLTNREAMTPVAIQCHRILAHRVSISSIQMAEVLRSKLLPVPTPRQW